MQRVRLQKIDLNHYIILTSRNSVDHFFRVADEMRFKVPEGLKYFCQSEAVAFYLQKYVVYRKRKIYVGPKFCRLISFDKKIQRRKNPSDQLNADATTIMD
jgi:uroporphyrinogen-III synthase